MAPHRIDSQHTTHTASAGKALTTSTVFPELNRRSMRFELPQNLESRLDAATEFESCDLDTILVCPKCECLPTIRPGCPQCGCGVLKREPLIHHFACAHVGPAEEFRQGDDLVCPKCCVNGLVAGTDFEQAEDRFLCPECDLQFATPVLIGHCVTCDHRFALDDAKEVTLTGYRIQEIVEQKSNAKPLVRAPRLNRRRQRGRQHVQRKRSRQN